MKLKMKSKLMVVVMSLAMALAVLPLIEDPAHAAAGDPAINLVAGGTASNIRGAQASSIWFGNYDQGNIVTAGFNHEPIKWRVLHNGNEKFLLLADKNLDCRKYHETKTAVTWETSNIRAWLNEDFKRAALSTGEEGAVKTEAQDKIFLLSTEECMNTGYGFTEVKEKTDTRSAQNTDYTEHNGAWSSSARNGMWWLRSTGNNNEYAALVDHDGSISTYGEQVDNPKSDGQKVAVRPALNIDHSQVVFTSANDGKKSDTVGEDALTQVGTNESDEWKLTVKDEAHKNFAVTKVTAMTQFLHTYGVEVTYTGARVGENEYISAIITDKPITEGDAKIKYYGRIKACTSSNDASGTVTIDYDEKKGSNDHLYVLNEQCNDNYKTDYSSALQDARISVMTFVTALSWNNDDGEKANRPEKVVMRILADGSEFATIDLKDKNGQWGYYNSEMPIYDSQGNRITYSVKVDEVVNKYGRHYITAVENVFNVNYLFSIRATLPAKSKLTITAKDQSFAYDGGSHGPGDTVYDDPAQIAEKVTVSGLTDGDSLSGLRLIGQGKEEGEYDITPSDARIGGFDASKKYDVTYTTGKLKITHVCRNFKKTERVAPTCTRDGTEAYWTCGICNRMYSDKDGRNEIKAPVKIKALGYKCSTLLAGMTAKGQKGLAIRWTKVTGAAGYDIFFASCHYGNKKFTAKKVKTFKGNKTFKWTKTGLKKNASYKAYVKAYVYKNGKKTYVRTSPVIHAYTSNGTKKYTNARSVSLNKNKVTLKKGRAFNIKAKVNKVRKNRKLMPKSHVPTLRYMTTNSRIAAVNGNGRITAKAKGTCYIYVYAHNGVSRQIRVTVK